MTGKKPRTILSQHQGKFKHACVSVNVRRADHFVTGSRLSLRAHMHDFGVNVSYVPGLKVLIDKGNHALQHFVGVLP